MTLPHLSAWSAFSSSLSSLSSLRLVTIFHQRHCVFLPLPQVYIIDPAPNPNISTFKPVPQMINDNKKYNGNGYLPCNGFVPCQVCVTVWGVEHDHPCHSAWPDGTLAAGGEAGGGHALSWLSGKGGGARGMLVIRFLDNVFEIYLSQFKLMTQISYSC